MACPMRQRLGWPPSPGPARFPSATRLLYAWRPCGAHLLPPDCRLAPDRSAEFPEAPAPLPTGSAGLPGLDRSRMTPRAPVRNAHEPFAQSPGEPVGRPSLTLQPETPVGHPSPQQAGTGHGQAAACPRPIYSDKLPDKPPAQALTLSSSGRARPMLQGAESRFWAAGMAPVALASSLANCQRERPLKMQRLALPATP